MEKDLCCQNTSRSWKPGRIPAFSVTSPAIAQSQAYLLQLKVIPFGLPQHQDHVLYLLLMCSTTDLVRIRVPVRSHRRLPLPLLALSLHHSFSVMARCISTELETNNFLLTRWQVTFWFSFPRQEKTLKYPSRLRSLIQKQATLEDNRF